MGCDAGSRCDEFQRSGLAVLVTKQLGEHFNDQTWMHVFLHKDVTVNAINAVSVTFDLSWMYLTELGVGKFSEIVLRSRWLDVKDS